MATTGPMLVTELHISTANERPCSCGRSSRLFYRLWLGVSCAERKDGDALICSYCAGERLQFVPYYYNRNADEIIPVAAGRKLVLLPDPRSTLTDEERADVQETPGQSALREWALQHGQGALPYRVENGLEWEKLAEFQWAKCKADARLTVARSIYESKFEFIERKDMRLVQVKARRTPTEREVSILEETREAWCELEPEVPADLDLVWSHPIGEKARTELQVSLCTPNGGLRRLFYALPQ